MKHTLLVLSLCALNLAASACTSVRSHARAELAPPVMLDDAVAFDAPAPIARTVEARHAKPVAARAREMDSARAPRPRPNPGPSPR